MNKPFKTYEEQVNLLISRGLIIENKDEAIRLLQKHNYYNFVNAYKEIFLASTSPEIFLTGCNISHIEAFRQYDKILQNHLLPLILAAENMLKSIIAHEFANTHGPCAYYNKKAFNICNNAYEEQYKNLISSLNHSIKGFKLDCIKHYNTHYNCVPIWVLVNVMTFGNIFTFYSLLDHFLKEEIAKSVSSCLNYNISESEFLTILKFYAMLVIYAHICSAFTVINHQSE